MFHMAEPHHHLWHTVSSPYHLYHYHRHHINLQEYLIPENYGKPRNRFSEYEDAVICKGVLRGLTWGQISAQLPNRKRATCFNRYRTLQGIRKSRKSQHQRMMPLSLSYPLPITPASSRRASVVSSCSSSGSTPSPPLMTSNWLPTTPPSFKEDTAHLPATTARSTPASLFFNDIHHHHQPGYWMGPVGNSRYHLRYH